MTRRLSKWSKPGETPPMVGVWETDFCSTPDCPTYQYWDGREWKAASDFAQGAFYNKNMKSLCDPSVVRFRGLADKPE